MPPRAHESRRCQRCRQGNLQWGDDDSVLVEKRCVRRDMRCRELAVCAAIDDDRVRAARRDENDPRRGGARRRDRHSRRTHAFAREQIQKRLAVSIASHTPDEVDRRAEACSGNCHVRALAAVGLVVVAAEDGFTFVRQAVRVHDQGHNIAADDDYATGHPFTRQWR